MFVDPVAVPGELGRNAGEDGHEFGRGAQLRCKRVVRIRGHLRQHAAPSAGGLE